MVGPFQEEMGRAKERLAAAHGAASRALYTFYEANQVYIREIEREREREREKRTNSIKQGRDDSERILNEVNQMEKQNPQVYMTNISFIETYIDHLWIYHNSFLFIIYSQHTHIL